MSSRERRERHKQATRESILSAALEIARIDGWEAVTIRHVAERIEYSSPIIYEYFANKGALLEELQEQGFGLLEIQLRGAGVGGETARERVLQVADAYVCFAYEQPELYQLMHGWNSVDVSLSKTLSRATQVAEIVQDCLETWAAAQKINLSDPAAALEIGWSLLHGLVSVEMLGRLGGGKERVRQLAKRGIEDLLAAWAA